VGNNNKMTKNGVQMVWV